jgi:CHAT domain-containing protein
VAAAIGEFKDTPEQARKMADLVWPPIAGVLPKDTATLYLSADGDLARLPWAALPGTAAGTVLLQDYAIATVPHGPFLLEQLRFPNPEPGTGGSVVALGNVDYGPASDAASYRPLAGTKTELRQLEVVAGSRTIVRLAGVEANWPALRRELPSARVAHLATHGFFAEAELSQERARAAKQLQTWQLDLNRPTERIGMGTRSLLGYTGLVLAGANQPTKDELHLATGTEIVELPLEELRLVVLSACETGLGDLTGGEGVQGLQRAFHLAGCPNVIASLWNVNDAATAALMAKFYHALWVEKKDPLSALREAQLMVYRHPELIPDLAGERGAPKFKDAVAAKASVEPSGRRARADTKLWAAFVLSGVGK